MSVNNGKIFSLKSDIGYHNHISVDLCLCAIRTLKVTVRAVRSKLSNHSPNIMHCDFASDSADSRSLETKKPANLLEWRKPFAGKTGRPILKGLELNWYSSYCCHRVSQCLMPRS